MRLSSFRRLSELGSGEGTEDEAFKGLWDLDVLNSPRTPFKWEHLVALLIVILSIVAGRWLYDGFFRLLRLSPPLSPAPLHPSRLACCAHTSRWGSETPFELANQLTKRDNKALCVSFASFILGIGIVTTGSLRGSDLEVLHPASGCEGPARY